MLGMTLRHYPGVCRQTSYKGHLEISAAKQNILELELYDQNS